MYFHNSVIPRGAYFLLPLESEQCISEVKVNQLKVKNIHFKMEISTFKGGEKGTKICHCHHRFIYWKSALSNALHNQPLAKGDLVDHILHTLPMYKDCLGIIKEQCKNSKLPHFLMIIMHGETLRSPALQLMEDDDDDDDDDDNHLCDLTISLSSVCVKPKKKKKQKK